MLVVVCEVGDGKAEVEMEERMAEEIKSTVS